MDKFNNIKIGQSATIQHEITIEDIQKFVALTGDDNKLHIDKDYASNTDFKIPVVHGMLGASFISTVIGTKLPGDEALWYSQSLEFLRPVRVGDTLLVTALEEEFEILFTDDQIIEMLNFKLVCEITKEVILNK